MKKLWDRMAAIYGHKWSSNFTNSALAMATWQKALADMSREQLSHGLKALMTRGDPWPPSLPEFLELCRPPAPDPAHTLYRALPKPKPNPERAASAFSEMKNALSRRQTA